MDTETSHEVSVDWKGRPCRNSKHGGMRAAVFVLGTQAFEITAIAAVGNNLITYVFNEMHFPLSKSANIVTNFIGTVFLLSLLGGFISDSYLGSFWTMLIFGFVELSDCRGYSSVPFLVLYILSSIVLVCLSVTLYIFQMRIPLKGFILLSVQAHLPQLRPPKCNMLSAQNMCEEVKGFKSTIFFIALYLVALGSGCLKPNMIAHGADQFRKDDPQQSKKVSTYFNAAYFSFCVGELIALTVLVWVQTKSGMDIGFGVSAAAMALALVSLVSGVFLYRNKPPQGSIFTPISRVFVAAITKRKQVCPSNPETIQGGQNNQQNHVNSVSRAHDGSPHANKIRYTNKLRFLDKACIKTQNEKESPWRLCTAAQVEQVKSLILVIPIFACTIVFNTVLAQLQTFSVQQGALMDTRLFSGSFKVPPASLQSIPYIVMILLVPLYELLLVPFARRFTGISSGITPLQRMGVGLFTVTFSMVVAAVVEQKRRESEKPISIWWIAPQFLVFGLSEMFTAVGLIEFFYKQSLVGMQSFLTSMTYCSYSFGFYLSSVLVSFINKFTYKSTTRGGWLSDNDLNKDRLDLFYWLLAALCILNFFNYLFWSRWYSTSIDPNGEYVVDTNGEEEQRMAFSKEDGNEADPIV